MQNLTINFYIKSAYLTLEEYSKASGIPVDTCRGMVRDGRIIIRPKQKAKGKVEVNMIAMLKDAISNS